MNALSVSNWQPPPGYIQVESQLSGVTVYAPAPQVEAGPEAQDFKCPKCGGTTAFDPTAASIACAYCGYVQALDADVVGAAAAEREFTLENLALADRDRGWGEERRNLYCNSCGADLSLAADDLSTTCAFCGSNRVVARVAASDTLRPRFLVPFQVDADDCTRLARQWLGRSWMHPSGLSSAADSARFQGIYLPFWTFSANIRAHWKAQVGYEETERYYDHQDDTWKSRTTIDWRWESGDVELTVEDLLSLGTTKINRVLLDKIAPFDLQALTVYEPGFLAGWQAQSYDVPLQDAWDAAKATMRERARRACRDEIHSSHVRNFSMTADFDDEVWRYILLPVFVAVYHFGGRAYQILINGQTSRIVGQRPVAWRKVWAVIAGLLLPGVILGLVGLMLPAGEPGAIPVPLAIGGTAFVVGLLISLMVLGTAMKEGES